MAKINNIIVVAFSLFCNSCFNPNNSDYEKSCYINAISYIEQAISSEIDFENQDTQAGLFVADKLIVPNYLGFAWTLDCEEINFTNPEKDFGGSEACPSYYLNELLEKYQRKNNKLPSSISSYNDALISEEKRLKLYFSELQHEHLYGLVVDPAIITFESDYAVDFSGKGMEFLFKFDKRGEIEWAYKRITRSR
jgi:hypothetical protein